MVRVCVCKRDVCMRLVSAACLLGKQKSMTMGIRQLLVGRSASGSELEGPFGRLSCLQGCVARPALVLPRLRCFGYKTCEIELPMQVN